MSQRSRFLALVLEQMGQPYGWNKKGSEAAATGSMHRALGGVVRQFDCSGLVTWAFSRDFASPVARHWTQDVNTDGLLARGTKTNAPAPGTLCLYGKDDKDMSHVMVYVMPGLVVGACGGGERTVTVADALRNNARVQTRPGHDYRKDFRWFVELPFADEATHAG